MNDRKSLKLQLSRGCDRGGLECVLNGVRELGLRPLAFRDAEGARVGVTVGRDDPRAVLLGRLPGVEKVVPVYHEFALASHNFQAATSTVVIRGSVRAGGGHLLMIAGPCSVEGFGMLDAVAGAVKAAGANVLRGGAFKPRTSPYSFQGLGEEGLKILRDVGAKHDMPVVTEVTDPRQVEVVERYADMFQVGARNMQNFDLLKEVGRASKPVLLKRGMSATVKDLLTSAEYVLAEGNGRVVLCERGVRSFEDSTRNMLDMSAVPNVKGQSHLPIIVDPTHATGRPDLIPAMARAALAAGADGVHVEVHPCPEKALSDGPQALPPGQYAALMDELTALASFLGKVFNN
jgi:3-deoxy-7-phosphoheptulonate synthase